ncbi:hypothetical protein AGMMS50239_16140 [Bacteroidia bacterium]|nr:hypothetical protein AGMMS50239_16140 [Bacteroidia bacterium]
MKEKLYLDGDYYTAPAVYVKEGAGSWQLYYICRDYLGSITHITNSSGSVVQELSYDAWGRLRNPANQQAYAPGQEPELFLGRGYTGHEHLTQFGLINMNARLYDPAVGRFLLPDPYVQMPDFSQSFNRYTYCLNNPFAYTDPSGENPILIAAIIIGAAAGGYTGYKIADAKGYDFGNWQTYAYMLGGTAIGGASGYLGATVAAGGGFMANTMGIVSSSFFNSMGMTALSGGMMSPSVSFGVASYDFGSGEWGYLGKKGNKWYQNLGYGFGALANLSDAVSLFRGGGQNVKVNSASTKDGHEWWGHSSITDENGNTLVSVGPDSQVQKAASLSETWRNSIKGADVAWDTYLGDKGTWSVELNNVSTTAISKYASGVTRWDLLLNSCVGHTSRALWSAGVPNIYLFHPHLLNFQLMIRQLGIYSSPYLYQIR